MNETSIEYGDHSDEIEQETASEMPEPSQWSTEASNTQTAAREDGFLFARTQNRPAELSVGDSSNSSEAVSLLEPLAVRVIPAAEAEAKQRKPR
jgi:hypothetical protein